MKKGHKITDTEDQREFNINSNIKPEEIKTVIKSYMASDKSFDNNKFHPVMMKHFGELALTLLSILFNICLATSTWVWDKAEVIFLKKPGKDSYAKPGS